MADLDIVEIACARAWGAYILINRGIAENDVRRDKMKEFICERWEAGAQRERASGGRRPQISQVAGWVRDRLGVFRRWPEHIFGKKEQRHRLRHRIAATSTCGAGVGSGNG